MFVFAGLQLQAQEGTKNFIDQNFIEVNGKAEMQIVPDKIYLKITINEQDTKNKISLEQQEKKLLKTLADLGIDIEKDVLIKDMASNFKNYLLAKTDVMLSKDYQVLLHNPKMVNKLFIELEQLNISNISIEKLDHSKMDEYLEDVKIKAMKAAKNKAYYLAQAVGQEAGRALYIKEFNNQIFPNPQTNTLMVRGYASFDKKAEATNLDFEKITIESEILARFELK